MTRACLEVCALGIGHRCSTNKRRAPTQAHAASRVPSGVVAADLAQNVLDRVHIAMLDLLPFLWFLVCARCLAQRRLSGPTCPVPLVSRILLRPRPRGPLALPWDVWRCNHSGEAARRQSLIQERWCSPADSLGVRERDSRRCWITGSRAGGRAARLHLNPRTTGRSGRLCEHPPQHGLQNHALRLHRHLAPLTKAVRRI